MRYDGVRMGDGSGNGVWYEVFDPPWWKVWRHFKWHFLSRGYAKGCVAMTGPGGEVRLLRVRSLEHVAVRPM